MEGIFRVRGLFNNTLVWEFVFYQMINWKVSKGSGRGLIVILFRAEENYKNPHSAYPVFRLKFESKAVVLLPWLLLPHAVEIQGGEKRHSAGNINLDSFVDSLCEQQMWLTRCRRVPLEKLTVAVLSKKLCVFYENQSFVTVSPRANHWSLSWEKFSHFTFCHLVSWRSILILCACLCLRHCVGLFPALCLAKTFPHTRCILVLRPSRSPWLYYSNTIWRRVKEA